MKTMKTVRRPEGAAMYGSMDVCTTFIFIDILFLQLNDSYRELRASPTQS